MHTPFTIEHVKEGNYILIRVFAPVTRELAAEFTQQAQEAVKRLGCNGSLADVRGFPNVSSVNDNVEYSAWELKVSGAQADMKRAILIDADDNTHDIPILAMREMGYNAKDFTDEQEAIAWLTGAS